MTVPNFPAPVEGELYSSVIARYLRRTAGYAKRNLGMIGLHKPNAGALVPIEVVQLAESMPEGHAWANNPRKIVEKHTIVPLFLQSSTREFYESTIENISHGLNGNPSATLGLTKRVKNSAQNRRYNSKFCPACVSQDIEHLGFSVLYRHHQPDFVRYCANHNCPLYFSCINCNARTRTILWQMAGQCDCEATDTPAVIDKDLDEISKNSLLWIAKQVDHLLKDGSQHTNITHTLRDLLKSYDFITPSGKIRNSALINAVEKEIGSPLSYEFGFIAECPRRGSHRHDLSRIFHTNHHSTNIIYNLFVAKLFCNDIREISAVVEPNQLSDILYTKSKSLNKTPEKQVIQNALHAAKGVIRRASKIAGLNGDTFRTAARRLGIAIPLSERLTNRIGRERLQEIREAFKCGMAINEARIVFNLTKHTARSILCDQPSLLTRGKSYKSSVKVQSAKEKISALVELHPTITRSGLRKKFSRPMDLVFINDADWTNEKLPKSTTGKVYRSRNSLDWKERFKRLQNAIDAEKERELKKTQRPTRLTVTRLKKDCAMTHLNSFPDPQRKEMSNIFEAASESKDVFHDRLIEWAIVEYAKLLIPISSNKLRRIAGLTIKELLGCRNLVIKHAKNHNLGYHLQCSLSPFANFGSSKANLKL